MRLTDNSAGGGEVLVEIHDVTVDGILPPTAAQARTAPADRGAAATFVAAASVPNHSADTDLDFRLSLQELTRVIELYNTRNGPTRTGFYKVQAGSEDGFAGDPTVLTTVTKTTLSSYHSADSNRDGRIDLPELLRVIQLYNFRSGTLRTGAYHVWAAGEDGFAPSPQTFVTIVATKPTSDESGSNPGEYTITRTGDIQTALTVSYRVGGTGANGVDYDLLPGSITIPADAASVKIPLTPLPDLTTDGQSMVVVDLTLSAADYLVGAPSAATVTIADSTATLYIAYLRPDGAAGGTIGSGIATLLLSASGTLAEINISHSNLSSAQVSGYLRLSPTNDYVTAVPIGQVTGSRWQINPVGPYTRADLLDALKNGRIYISLDSARFPGGELTGTLKTAQGSQIFSAPPAPPGLPASLLASPSDAEAARLLLQATFGPTEESVAEVKRLGVDGWIRAQQALPVTSFRKTVFDEIVKYPTPERTQLDQPAALLSNLSKNNTWWTLAVEAPDQLRQRVGFALSEIFVITDPNGTPLPEEINYFYDQLVARAFGNYRDLIEFVSLNPVMAWYLTFLRNQKADPIKGTSPDENYAREVQQLFTVGLVQLHPDGTLLLDAAGRPIPTYDNISITETAKVFTGWSYQNDSDNFFVYPGKFVTREPEPDNAYIFRPLKNYPAFYDTTQKKVISLEQKAPREAAPTIIPAGASGNEALKILLDTLFQHPNTGPFVCRQLIQRLVSSNPSPGYVYRTAQVFANNGNGVRGDLGAVVRAILLDYEARSPDAASSPGFGKVKEPLIRMAGLWRLMKTAAPRGGFWDSYWGDPRGDQYHPRSEWLFGIEGTLGQNVLQSPSVFNFFSPSYTAPGILATSGLVAPEMQITDASFAIKVPNFLTSLVTRVPPRVDGAPSPSPFLRNDFTGLLGLSASPSLLVERLNILMAGGQMRSSTKNALIQAIAAIPGIPQNTNYADAPRFAVATGVVPLVAPKVAAFDPAGPFTLEAWVLPYVSQVVHIIGKSSSVSPFTLGAAGNGFFFAVAGAPGTDARVAYGPQSYPLGVWSHVAGVFDGSAITIYVNGVAGSRATNVPVPPAAIDVPLSIGQAVSPSGDGFGTRFDGAVAQARFWNVVRTADQIRAGMAQGRPSDATGLVAGWLLGEGTGTVAPDYSGRGYHLQPLSALIEWAATDGSNAERVRTALHLATISTDVAVQR